MLKLYKWLGDGRMPCHGGQGRWPELGVWFEVKGNIIPCHNGLHLCRRKDLPHWVGPTLWEVEYEGELVEHKNKVVVSKARLVRQLKWGRAEQMEFACRAAERQLHLFEKAYPKDMRPHDAIKAARSKNIEAAHAAVADAARASAHAAVADAIRASAHAAAYATRASADAANAARASAYAAADAAHAAADAANAAAYAPAHAAAYAADAAANAAAADIAANAANATERKKQVDDIMELTGEAQ